MTDLEQPAPSLEELDKALRASDLKVGYHSDRLAIAWLRTALPGLLATARDGDGAREVLYGPSVQRGADRLAGEVCWLVDRGRLDARSPAGDALLDYAAAKYGDHDPLGAVRKRYEEIQVKLAAARSTGSVDNG